MNFSGTNVGGGGGGFNLRVQLRKIFWVQKLGTDSGSIPRQQSDMLTTANNHFYISNQLHFRMRAVADVNREKVT